MKAVSSRWRRAIGLGVLALLLIWGCETRIYTPGPPPPPPPPPAPPPQVARPTFYVSASRLNLRACPGMDCPKISVLERNEEVEKVGAAEDWAQIRVKRDGRLGWVNSRYLSDQPLPAVEAAPPPLPPPSVVPPPPPLPETPATPPVTEKPKPEKAAPGARKKAEERPAKPRPAEAAEPAPRKPAPAAEKAPPKEEKPAPPAEKAPEPTPEKRIRIM